MKFNSFSCDKRKINLKKRLKNMKMNFYKYVLMTMAFLIGFHLYYVIMLEASFFSYSLGTNDEWMAEYLREMRLVMNFTNMLTFMVCIGLLAISIGLYLVEFYICKYIKSKRKSKI